MLKSGYWKSISFLKVAVQIAFALILMVFILYFVRNNISQLQQSLNLIFSSRPCFIIVAFLVSLMFIYLLGNIYKSGFEALSTRISIKDTLVLALKRNFVSVFLPAGSILSYAMFTSDIENKGISKTRIYLATVIYAISCTAALLIIALPGLALLLFSNELSEHFIIGFSILSIALVIFFLGFRSIFQKGIIYRMLLKIFPGATVRFNELYLEKYSMKNIAKAIMFSFFAESCGIIHLYLVSKALGVDLSISAILVSYAISTITYALSPLMRGIGAVEITLTLSLMSFGIPEVTAISISLFYRFFTFWLPLFISSFSFLHNKKRLIQNFIPVLSNRELKKELGK
jgi:phosphatidylglycerol lysyltransferase